MTKIKKLKLINVIHNVGQLTNAVHKVTGIVARDPKSFEFLGEGANAAISSIHKLTARGSIVRYAKNSVLEQFKDKVIPRPGSVLFVDLAVGLEHSGIYLGDGFIAEANSKGQIKKVSYHEFCETIKFGITIKCFVDQNLHPIHREEWYKRAVGKLGSEFHYRPISPKNSDNELNCHNFVTSCITGDFESNPHWTFLGLKELMKQYGGFFWRPCWRKIGN